MTLTRRELLKRGALIVPAAAILPHMMVRSLHAGSGLAKVNLVFIELQGGNDGVNTIVPYGLHGGAYYELYRPTLHVPYEPLIKLDGFMGLHHGLAALESHWHEGRLAVVQGVSYPNPSLSHALSKKIWASGDPTGQTEDGWLGRLLARYPRKKPRAFDQNRYLSPMFRGAGSYVPAFRSVQGLEFPSGAKNKKDGKNRRVAYRQICQAAEGEGGLLGGAGRAALDLLGQIDQLKGLPAFPHVASWPVDPLADALRLTLQLMHAGLGLRFHHIVVPGFDTHANQNKNFFHDLKVKALADSLDAAWTDLKYVGLHDKTLFVIYTEFGRAIHENASGGSDHGTSGPMLVFGGNVIGGFHGEHPSLDPAKLTAQKDLEMTTDLRDALGTVVERWLGEDSEGLFPGHTVADLDFLA